MSAKADIVGSAPHKIRFSRPRPGGSEKVVIFQITGGPHLLLSTAHDEDSSLYAGKAYQAAGVDSC